MARTKKSDSVPVRIRFKELENGNKSIYLDIYYEKKRRYEFLKLYLVPENSAEARRKMNIRLKPPMQSRHNAFWTLPTKGHRKIILTRPKCC